MSEINVMDFVEAMNAKNAEVAQANEGRLKYLTEVESAQKRIAALVAEVDDLAKALDMRDAEVARLTDDLAVAQGQLRESNVHKENLRELLAGF